MSEVSLYPAVKRFLESAGFDVKGEVKGCDIVAVRRGEPLTLAIVEMKFGFTLDLLPRATDRMPAADETWLAVPATRPGCPRSPSLPVDWLRPAGGQCRARPGRGTRQAGAIPAASGFAPAHAVAERNIRAGGVTHRPAVRHASPS